MCECDLLKGLFPGEITEGVGWGSQEGQVSPKGAPRGLAPSAGTPLLPWGHTPLPGHLGLWEWMRRGTHHLRQPPGRGRCGCFRREVQNQGRGTDITQGPQGPGPTDCSHVLQRRATLWMEDGDLRPASCLPGPSAVLSPQP